MNTASRMESTGERGKIQASKEAADLLLRAGKSQWVTPREETVVAKGKGELQTYWVSLSSGRASSSGGTARTTSISDASDDSFSHLNDSSTSLHVEEPKEPNSQEKRERLVSWECRCLVDTSQENSSTTSQPPCSIETARKGTVKRQRRAKLSVPPSHSARGSTGDH